MASLQPVVLEATDVQAFVQHVVKSHAPPSTLIVCSTKDHFLRLLGQSTETMVRNMDGLDNWLQTPTIRLLSTSRTLKIAFCSDITHLRAYLANYTVTVAQRADDPDTALRRKDVQPVLAVLNPIELHRPTSAFSAQGLNRTFSSAVEAAHMTGSKLIFAECPSHSDVTLSPRLDDESQPTSEDPWEEQLSILNVTTKRLGELSVGRTVKVRTVAQRWCTFEKMPQPMRY